MTDNMKIWDAVAKTDPKHTKKVSFGRKFTAIDAHYQVMKATEQFGAVGFGWGYDCEHSVLELRNGATLAVCDVIIWYEGESIEASLKHPIYRFGPVRGSAEFNTTKAPERVDTDAPKKAMTDALTKGLSHLGFSADVFLGLFDDNKYVAQREKEEAAGSKEDNDKAWLTKVLLRMAEADTVDKAKDMREKVIDRVSGMSGKNCEFFEKEYAAIVQRIGTKEEK